MKENLTTSGGRGYTSTMIYNLYRVKNTKLP